MKTKMRILSTEFYGKINHDFTTMIYLGLRKDTKDSDEVISMIVSRDGYESHKAVLYKGERVANFYIKFSNAICAGKAILFFRSSDWIFNAEAVNNLLVTWYIFEMTQDKAPTWTTAYVDVPGNKHQSALATRRIHQVLRPFGYIRVVPSRQISPDSVQVLFGSFAEALASTIALGHWSIGPVSTDYQSMVYRVRILGSTKEKWLFLASGSSLSEALDLDYFMPMTSSEFIDQDKFEYEAPLKECTKARYMHNKRSRPILHTGNSVYVAKPSDGSVECDNQNGEQTTKL